jgi:hypothetical protein
MPHPDRHGHGYEREEQHGGRLTAEDDRHHERRGGDRPHDPPGRLEARDEVGDRTRRRARRGASRDEPPHLRQRGHARHRRPVPDHERQHERTDQQPDEQDGRRACRDPEQEQQRPCHGRRDREPGEPMAGARSPVGRRNRVTGRRAQLRGVRARRAQPRGQRGGIRLAAELGGEVREVRADVVEDLRDLRRREVGQRCPHTAQVLLGNRARRLHLRRTVVGHTGPTSPSIVSANARHVFTISRRRSRPGAFKL